MSKHTQNITFRVRCTSIEQRNRLRTKCQAVAAIMEKEYAETLELLLDHSLPHFPIPMDRSPMERRMGADYMSETDKKQSGTSQGNRKQPNSGWIG